METTTTLKDSNRKKGSLAKMMWADMLLAWQKFEYSLARVKFTLDRHIMADTERRAAGSGEEEKSAHLATAKEYTDALAEARCALEEYQDKTRVYLDANNELHDLGAYSQ